MVSFAVPFSGFRVDIRRDRDRVPHEPSATHAHPHREDEARDVVVWFAYYDDTDGTARAVCPALSLIVERSTVGDAALEMEHVIAGIIEDAENPSEELRLLPKDLLVEQLNRFAKMLEGHPDQKGTAWLSGHRHMSCEEIPAQTA